MTHGPAPPNLPLVVDLDSALLRSDLLFESLVVLIRTRFLLLWLVPLWMLLGRAGFRRALAARVRLDPVTLQYDQVLLAEIAAQRALGRLLVLATGSPRGIAEAIAAHLRLFDRVLAGDSAGSKAARLVTDFGDRGFDYIGNGRAAEPVWLRCRNAYSVAAKPFRLADGRGTEQVGSARAGWSGSLVAALRPRQWLKNLLVFVPMFAGHAFTPAAAGQSALAFLVFSLCASSAYLLNDALDVHDDRQHPAKRLRPVASGALPLAVALGASPLLAAFGLTLAAAAGRPLLLAVGVYLLATLSYSLALKRLSMVDIVTLALLYNLRILGGCAATGIAPSFWLLAFSFFLFLSLALLKRHSELTAMLRDGRRRARGRGYLVIDHAPLGIMGIASALLSLLVFMLYFNSQNVEALYRHPQFLFGIVPLLVLWLGRLWLLSFRGEVDEDPVLYVSRDRASLAVIGTCLLLAVAAAW